MHEFQPLNSEIWDMISNKWTLLVVHRLGAQTLRFSELRRQAEPISQKMLTQTLRELERHGIVAREVVASKPPRVEYRLTEIGASFLEAAGAICRWTNDNREALLAAGDVFDRAHQLARSD